MSANVSGKSAAIVIVEHGGAVRGLASSENLAVDSTTDLAIGDGEDVAVFAGVMWLGTTAAQLLSAPGESAQMIAQPQ